MASEKSRKVHVTFGDSTRIMSYEEGAEVQELRSLFLRVFSDVLEDDISPANVKFQVLEYVHLGNDHHLEENAQIKATITSGNPMTASNPKKPHPIKKAAYRFWNPVSNGLMKKVGNKVTCSGDFDSKDDDTMIQAKPVGRNEFHLVYNGPNNSYLYITSKGKDQDQDQDQVTVSPTATDASVFVPDYYWSYTLFKSKSNSKLYLGTDSNKNAILVFMESPCYPNPQALFVVSEVNPS